MSYRRCVSLANTAHRNHAHQGRLVIAVQDVDEICDGQHTCGRKEYLYCLGWCVAMRFIGLLTHKPLRLVVPQRRSPQAVCNQRIERLLHLGQVRKMKEKWGLALFFPKMWEFTRDPLAAWYQIWPVYSWLEWRRSSSGSSWSSCRPWRRPLRADMVTLLVSREQQTQAQTQTHTHLVSASGASSLGRTPTAQQAD